MYGLWKQALYFWCNNLEDDELKIKNLSDKRCSIRNTGPNNQKFTLFTAAAVDLQQRVGQPQQQQQQLIVTT